MKDILVACIIFFLVSCSGHKQAITKELQVGPKVKPVFIELKSPAPHLFAIRANRNTWIKESESHYIHENNEIIFYFEQGFREFVVFDESGYPIKSMSY